MNFRFAHYDPPTQDKKRARKAANTSRRPLAKVASPDKAAQRKLSQRPGLHAQSSLKATTGGRETPEPRPSLCIAHRCPSVAKRGSSSPETVTSLLSSVSSSNEPDADSSTTSVSQSSSWDSERCYALPNLTTLLGEGRIDPFGVYPVEHVSPYVHMLLDHAIMHKWPNIVPTSCPATKPSSSLQVERKENLTNHPVKRAWLQCLLNHPVAFYALVYGSSQHLKFLHNGREVVPRAALLRLSYKTEAVKLINQALRDLHGRPIPDPVLIAILSLGAHGNESNHSAADDEASGNSTSSPQTRTTAPPNPLATAQLLNFYGALTQETAHMSALRTLLQHNNGTESITLPGLASAISLGDILNSTVTHRIPYVPHPGPLTPSVAAYLNLLPSLPLKTKSFPSGRQSAQLLESLTHSQALTAGLSSYLSLSSPPPPSPPQPQPHSVTNPTTAPPPTLEDLIISRNAVHHALLSLLPANGLWGPRFALYEALRLGMLIFSDLALFPLPAKTGVRGRYAGMLREALECILGGGGGDAGTRCREQQQKQGEMEAQGLAWACVMGALAVEGGDGEESRRKKAWFVESARGWMEVWGVVEWEEMQTMLQRWLWCRILLEGVGKAAWEGE